MKTKTYQGPVRIIDGHPVPYSATVERQRAGNTGEWVSVPAVSVLSEIDTWMRKHRPGQQLERTDGAYFFYGKP